MDPLKQASASMLKLKRPGTLTVMAYTDFYPVCYRDSTGKVRGSDPEIVRAFAAELGLKVKFVEAKEHFHSYHLTDQWDLKESCDALADMGIGGIEYETERESDKVEWSLPYAVVERTIVYNLKDKIERFPESVHGTILGTMGSTGFSDAYRRMQKKNKQRFLRPENDGDKVSLRRLLDGEIQGLMRGSVVGRALVAHYPKTLGMTTPWNAKGPRAPAATFQFPCLKRSGLAAVLSGFLGRATSDGTIERISAAAAKVKPVGIPRKVKPMETDE